MSKLVTWDTSGRIPVARVAGEIDLANAAGVRDDILAVDIDDVNGLVVDLTEVSYLDSAGVSALFEVARRIRQRDQTLAVTLPVDSPLRRLLKITGFQQAAPICDSTEAAVDVISQRSGDH